MDFGLDAFVAVTPPAPASTPAQAGGASVVDSDATAFAAHLATAEDGGGHEVAETPVEDAGAPDAEALSVLAPAAPAAILPQPVQILLQLIGTGAAGDAGAESAVGGEAADIPAAPGAPPVQINADAAKSAPAPSEGKALPSPATTTPIPLPTAEANAAAPTPEDATAPPSTSTTATATTVTTATTAAGDVSLAASTTAAPSLPVGSAKPATKYGSISKSDIAEPAAPATAGESLGADAEDVSLPAREAGTNRDQRASAPQVDSRNARAEPAVAPNAESVAAPTPAPHASSTASGAMPAIAIGVDHSAATTPARTGEAAPAAAQVAQEIVRRFNGDTTHFEVRLDPPELGRVEVRLEVTRDNKVSATVVADSPQTLVELARHARDLQNSLQSAGLDLAEHGLSFDLRDSGREAHHARAESDGRRAGSSSEAAVNDTAPRARALGLDPWRGRTLDMTA